MGNRASEEAVIYYSVKDLAQLLPTMKVLPALTSTAQVAALKVLWQNLHWVSPRTVLAHGQVDRLVLLVRGEAEVVLRGGSEIFILPSGTFFGEAALLQNSVPVSDRRDRKSEAPLWMMRNGTLGADLLGRVGEFLVSRSGRVFQARIQATERSLVTELTHEQLASVLPHEERAVLAQAARCNRLQNVLAFSAGSRRRLGDEDVTALRVVCDNPIRVACSTGWPNLEWLGNLVTSTNR
jgi:hypothetical protein